MTTATAEAPIINVNDCVWDAFGDWEGAYYGSVQDARDRSRGQARANFSREVGEAVVNISVWKRWIQVFTRQDVWDGPGHERWFDEWMDREAIDMRYLPERHEWIYIKADTGERLESPDIPEIPEKVPDDWDPSEYDPCWRFVDKNAEGAVPVWICAMKGNPAP